MALNNPYEYYTKVARKVSLITLIIVAIVFNLVQFCRYSSVNSQKIVEYQSKRDEFALYRQPLITAFFYQLEQGLPQKIIMAVVPSSALIDEQVIVTEMFRRLQQKGGIRNNRVLIVTDKPPSDLQRLIALKLGIEPEIIFIEGKGAQKAKNIILERIQNNYFIFWSLNLNSDQQTPSRSLLENIAEELSLLPETHDLLDNATIKAIDTKIKTKGHLSLAEQYRNLLLFIQDYGHILNQIINGFLSAKTENLTPSAENLHLWDKGAAMTVYYDATTPRIIEYGKIEYNRPLIENLAHSLRQAIKKHPNNKLYVFILTETKEKKYKKESAFENDLSPGEDGVILVHGSRQGVMLPIWWKIYPNKKEFINQLKIKSGLSPDFWSEKIKIYYFKAVEISSHEN